MSSGIAQKMFPPIISGTIPAFYSENGAAIMTVPFSLSRAVNPRAIGGLIIKIKTVQSNTLLRELQINNSGLVENMINSGLAKFEWNEINDSSVEIGQYLKVQMAFMDKNNNIGYFSTVGVTKYTDKPDIYIKDIEQNVSPGSATPFKYTYTGIYKINEDLNERPDSYCFLLYNAYKELVENSGWKVHNSSVNNIYQEAILPDETSDTYTFETALEPDKIYYIQYGVRTINNLELFSNLYSVTDVRTLDTQIKNTNLVATNNYDDGYVELKFNVPSNKLNKTIPENSGEGVSIAIYRASKINGFNDWRLINKFFCTNYATLATWQYKDFAIEQGNIYQYCFRQYNEAYMYSNRKVSNEVLADFEDMFLWDGHRQLKIKFNPKVTSFKTTQAEQKLETIGGKFPFIFKNSNIGYKEFPISGLISYWSDENQLFINLYQDLGVTALANYSYDYAAGMINFENDIYINQRSITPQNIAAERKFKLLVLDWLNNGEYKIFKSPAEGNYIVRLMNVSLSPEDKLGRMLHSFTATAYEMAEFTYNNLISLKFLNPAESTETIEQFSSFKIKDRINEAWIDSNHSIKLNSYSVLSYLSIIPAISSNNGIFNLRIGADTAQNIVTITSSLLLEDVAVEGLPSIYINYNDNKDFIEDTSETDFKQQLIDLVGDAVLTYNYYTIEVPYGVLYNIKNITLTNKITTFIGTSEPKTITFGPANVSATQTSGSSTRILQFLNLEFQLKTLSTTVLYLDSGKYYDSDNTQISKFVEKYYYKVVRKSNNAILGYYCSYDTETLEKLADNESDINTTVNFLNSDNTVVYSFTTPPTTINFIDYFKQYDTITKIQLYEGTCLDASYWERKVTYG